MIMKPCTRCPERQNCDIKKSALSKLRLVNTEFTTVTIKCAKLKDLFAPGTRVKVELWVPRDDPEGISMSGNFGKTTINGVGTVTKYVSRTRRFLVQFDEPIEMFGKEPQRMLSIWPDRLVKIDEPKREVCEGGYACTPDGDCDEASFCRPCDRERNPSCYSRF